MPLIRAFEKTSYRQSKQERSLAQARYIQDVKEAPFIHIVRPARKPQKILLCGWRRDIDDMIVVLDACLAPGSKLCTWFKVVDVNEVPEKEREKKLIDGGLDINRLVNITLVNCEGNVVIRCHLESIPLESFDSAKRLPYKEAAPGTQVQRGNSFSQGSWIGEIQQASDNSVIIRKILDSRTKNLLYGMNEYDVQSKISHTGSWIGETEVVSQRCSCKLGHLKQLRGKVEIHNLEEVTCREEAQKADLLTKKDLCEELYPGDAVSHYLPNHFSWLQLVSLGSATSISWLQDREIPVAAGRYCLADVVSWDNIL
ncbi:hypothetical protein LguiA_017772 [Lonicera macranthoides]